jgi:hypothetical protein
MGCVPGVNGYDIYGNVVPIAQADTDCNGNFVASSAVVPAGIDASTVSPNPAVPAAASASPSTASDLSTLGSVMGQWGATIAGIVTNTPTVVSPTGARTGAAAAPITSFTSGGGSMLLLIVVVVIVIAIVAEKK